jgi:hypothetical protein
MQYFTGKAHIRFRRIQPYDAASRTEIVWT